MINHLIGSLSEGFGLVLKVMGIIPVLFILIIFLVWNFGPKDINSTTSTIANITETAVMNEIPWWADPSTYVIVIGGTVTLGLLIFGFRNGFIRI